MHATSSRNHAMIFHHSNGSCYVVDCGSSHGTYINGTRINSSSKAGVVVPVKVRRGGLIRFGGAGAPCFVLKSFSFHLDDILVEPEADEDDTELVRRNTRINSLGKTAGEIVVESVINTIDRAIHVSMKRSFDSIDSGPTLDDMSMFKRRCTSPPLTVDAPLPNLVSPEFQFTKTTKLHVSFSNDPPQLFYPALVTPDDLSSEEDNDLE